MKAFLSICISVICSVMFFSSCSTTSLISFEHLTAAEVGFPAEIRKVAVVNNVSDSIGDSLRYSYTSPEKPIKASYLSIISGDGTLTTNVLAEALGQQQYFDVVMICDSALRINDTTPRMNRLTQTEVEILTEDLGVDMLISLDKIPLKLTRHLLDWDLNRWVKTTVEAIPIVSFYIPSRIQPLIILQKSDSIYWVNTLMDFEFNLINDMDILRESSEFAGEIAASYIVPTWVQASRFMFSSGSSDLKDGAFFAKNNQWENALPLWEKAYQQNKGSKKAKAASNISLYYEMNSELEKANEWMEKAIDALGANENELKEIEWNDDLLGSDKAKILYNRQAMKKRVKDLPKLQPQLQRFEDDFLVD